MSGVEVDPECKVAYDETLMGHMYRYVTFKIDDGKIRIDKVTMQSPYQLLSLNWYHTLTV